jgi:hypothetical protein
MLLTMNCFIPVKLAYLLLAIMLESTYKLKMQVSI